MEESTTSRFSGPMYERYKAYKAYCKIVGSVTIHGPGKLCATDTELRVLQLLYADPFPKVGGIIPPLFNIVETCLEFYYDELRPFYASLVDARRNCEVPTEDWLEEGRELWNGRPLYEFLIIFEQLGTEGQTYGKHFHPSLTTHERYRRGLFRSEQATLVGMVLKALTDELMGIMKSVIELEDCEDTREIISSGIVEDKLKFACRRTRDFLHVSFIINDRFRSERLEALLLKHLAEDEVNLEFVRKLDERERRKRRMKQRRRFGRVGDEFKQLERASDCFDELDEEEEGNLDSAD